MAAKKAEAISHQRINMIIGITGTDGAGKGTVVEYLKENDFVHYSSRDFLVKEIKKQGLEVTRNEMRLMGNKMRAAHGNEFIAKRAYELIRENNVKNAVVESIRAQAEAEYIKKHGGILLAVDADPIIRFKRVQARRSESDQVDYKTFLAHEELEKNDPDPNGMQKAKVMEMADYTILNNGTITELLESAKQLLEALNATENQ